MSQDQTATERPEVIVRIPFPASALALLKQSFTVHHAPTLAEFEAAIAAHPATRAVITNDTMSLSGAQMRALPKLEFVHTQGVGYESLDVETARALGLVICTGKGTNAASVADHAMALLLGITRNIPWANDRVRQGLWNNSRAPRPLISGKKLGILGLGDIGVLIAARAAGFGMEVSYRNRNPRSDSTLTFHASPLALAEASDIVIITLPGGAGTKGMVGAEFLQKLGPKGFLVNVGRGTVVDNAALIEALEQGTIAGAALDVVQGEPEVSPEMLAAPNLIFTPHMAGRAPEAVADAMARINANLLAHFSGGPLVSRVL